MTVTPPGRRLSGRYRVEELLLDVDAVRSWRAVDEVLGRSVLVQSLPEDDPRAGPLTAAARAAALVADARFLRVLDVGTQDGAGYVVREWLPGSNLHALLTEQGGLAPERAGWLAREVAEALRAAHEQGLHHLALTPRSVIVGPDGEVKVTGLATDAVLRRIAPLDPDDAARADAVGVGRILYASLTGRWPTSGHTGETAGPLRAAPMVDGHLPSPRQVRAGVPRALDDVADRVLGDPPRHGAALLTSPADVAAALAAAVPAAGARALGGPVNGEPRPAPALVDVAPLADPDGPPTQVQHGLLPPPRASRPAPPPPPRSGSQLRVLGVVTALVIVAGAALLGLQLLLASLSDDGDDGTSGPSASASATAGPLEVVAATDYDPLGNGDESPREVALAFDGDAGTAWETSTYYDPLELQKPGVGLVLDAGEVRQVAGAQVTFVNGGGDVELRAAPPDAAEPPETLEGWTAAAATSDVDGEAELRFDEPVQTRYVLVWFTRLPPVDGGFRDGIAEAVLLGP